MGCEHKRIKSVNCVLYCMDCGAKVDGETTSSGAVAPPSPEGKAFGGTEKKPRRSKKGAEKE